MLRKILYFFIPVIIAIVILVVLKQNKAQPVRVKAQEKVTAVRIISIPSVDAIPKATGYGTVQPASNWRAISQVKGKVSYKHKNLKKGSIIHANELLIEIDPIDYQLNITQTQADISAIEAQLSELLIKGKNTHKALKIEEKSLKLIENELQRQRKVAKKGGVSFSEVEKQERNFLAQQQIVQNQHNSLNLIPSQKALLDAQYNRLQAHIHSLQRDLENTKFVLPFSGRIAEVNIEENQYIREGELLLTVDSLDKAEIEVQLPLSELRSLMYSDAITKDASTSIKNLSHKHQIQAQVQLKIGDETLTWQARFARLSDTLDPKTRTVGVIIEVDKPYSNIQPGIRPPLIKGLFVSVKLSGNSHKESIIIPNSAIHSITQNKLNQKVVYLVNQQSRLEIRPISIKMIQDEYTMLNPKTGNMGVEMGEKLIISQLLPAIENMLLSTQEDETLTQHIIQQAISNHD